MRNAFHEETLRLFGSELEWLRRPKRTSHNEWVALVLQMGHAKGDRRAVVAARYTRTPVHIAGICTDYRTAAGMARAILAAFDRAQGCEIVIDMPSATAAGSLQTYGFSKKRGSFHCPDGCSVEYSYSPQSQNAPKPFNPGGHAHLPIRPSWQS